MLLDSNLDFVKDLIPSSAGMKEIFALHPVEQNGELFVSDNINCKLTVFQL